MEYTLHFHAESDKSYLVSDTGNHKDGVWLPKSRVEIVKGDAMPGTVVEMEVPDWLAEREGLA